jgi:hypothetical protein
LCRIDTGDESGAPTSISSKGRNGWAQTNGQHPVRSLIFILARQCCASGGIWRGLSIMNFSLFSVCSSSKNCPSARCASAANVVCRDGDIFRTKTLSLKHIL